MSDPPARTPAAAAGSGSRNRTATTNTPVLTHRARPEAAWNAAHRAATARPAVRGTLWSDQVKYELSRKFAWAATANPMALARVEGTSAPRSAVKTPTWRQEQAAPAAANRGRRRSSWRCRSIGHRLLTSRRTGLLSDWRHLPARGRCPKPSGFSKPGPEMRSAERCRRHHRHRVGFDAEGRSGPADASRPAAPDSFRALSGELPIRR